MEPYVLTLLSILLIIIHSSPTTSTKQTCTAGVQFLKPLIIDDDNSNDILITPSEPTIINQELLSTDELQQQQRRVNNNINSNNHHQSTYIIKITYPCDKSPLPRIEKLRKSVHDPFVSFHLKRKVREISEYGSGDYDDDDDDDDDDDEEDEEEEEGHVEPSNHVIPNLPTPSLSDNNNLMVVTPSYRVSLQSSQQQQVLLLQNTGGSNITPTKSFNYYVPTSAFEDSLLSPNLIGSGDGANNIEIYNTPLYNPSTSTDNSYVSTNNNNNERISSTTTTYSSPQLYLLHPIPKQLLYSGSPYNYTIPQNTFQPACEEYELQQDNTEPWIHVQGSNILFYPTTTHVSEYNLMLRCKSSPSSYAELFVSVRQRQKSRLYNHGFIIQFGMIRGNLSRVEVLNQVTHDIRKTLNSWNDSDLVLTDSELESYPFRVSYVNESILSNVCPVNELKLIHDTLNRFTEKTPEETSFLIHIENIRITVPNNNNQCDLKTISGITGGGDSSVVDFNNSRGGGSSGSSVVSYGENYPPSIKNQIDRLNASVGDYLVFKVMEDFCYDPEDGGTRNLRVELRDSVMGYIKEDYWLQFDGKNQEFFGLPMEVEKREFVLVCLDSGGKSANDVLELQVYDNENKNTIHNTEFSVHFESIPFTPKAIRKFIEKLSQILSPHIQVHSYAYSNNHVLFKWFNTTNPKNEHEITSIRKVLLSDDGPVNKRFFEHFTPDFNITVASVIPLRGLLSENNPTGIDNIESGGGGIGGGNPSEGDHPRYFDFDEKEDSSNIGGGGGVHDPIDNVVFDTYSGYLMTYIIPSVLIAIMVLLALIIACLLSRKNKYTQASTDEDDSSTNPQGYLKNAKKGVPVIFQDELDEKLFGTHSNQNSGGTQHHQNQPHHHHQRNTLPQSTTTPAATPQSTIPRATHAPPPPPPNFPIPHQPPSTTPQPPDYQNSISRNNRSRNHHQGSYHPIGGGVNVLPPRHHAHPYNNPHGYGSQYSPIQAQQTQHIDSYAPPPGINYYGIHNSVSGGFGNNSNNAGGGSSSIGGGNNGRGMPPPPYVPP